MRCKSSGCDCAERASKSALCDTEGISFACISRACAPKYIHFSAAGTGIVDIVGNRSVETINSSSVHCILSIFLSRKATHDRRSALPNELFQASDVRLLAFSPLSAPSAELIGTTGYSGLLDELMGDWTSGGSTRSSLLTHNRSVLGRNQS